MKKIISSKFLYNPLKSFKTIRRKILVFVLILLILVSTIQIWNFLTPKEAAAAWFDDSYAYRVKFTFTHNADISSERAVTFTLDTAELISANLMQSDCDDTRFTSANGKPLLYDLTGTCNNAATTYEVIFPSIVNGSNLAYVYYANPAAANGEIDSTGYTALTPSGGDPSETAPTTNDEQGPGPISYWAFDEGFGTNAFDSTNHGFLGSLTNSPTWLTEDLCIIDKCLRFNGSNSYVNMGNVLDQTGANPFTISTWFRTTAGGATVYGFVTKAKINSPYTGYTFGLNQVTASSGDAGKIGFALVDATLTIVRRQTTATFNDAVWHHASVTYDGSKNRSGILIYVDGKLQIMSDHDSSSFTGSISNAINFEVGARDGTNQPMKGDLDNVKFYNFAKTAAQIQTEYASRGTSKGVSAQFGNPDLGKTLSNGLVGYWKMDESSGNYTDSSGNGLTATDFNASTGVTGVFANARSFNGTTQYGNVANTAALNPTQFTVALWVKKNSEPDNYDRIMEKRTAGSQRGWELNFDSDSPTRRIYVGTYNSVGGGTVYSGTKLDIGTWRHVVFTFDGTNGALYENGQLVDADTLAGTYTTSVNPLFFANNNAGTARSPITIDEARFYSRALSSAEVAALYNWAPGPVGWWKLDENNGPTANDSSGNSNTGTLTSGPTWSTGKFGSALKFDDNSSNYVLVPNSSSLTISSAITISAWVNVNTLTNEVIFCKGFNSVNIDYSFQVSNTGATNRLNFWGGGAWRNGTAGTFTTTGVWKHVAVTYDGNTFIFYVDGIQSGTVSVATTLQTSSNAANIGRQCEATANTMNGKIDQVRIYNYARTPKQIVEDMNAVHPAGGSPIASQIAYWTLDEQQGQSLNNSNSSVSLTAVAGTTSGSEAADPTWKLEDSCKINGCQDFDGATEVDTITNADAIDFDVGLNTGVTFSAWVNPDTIGEGTGGEIFRKSATTYCQLTGSTPFNIVCSLDLGTDATKTVSSVIPASTWTHVAVGWADDTDDEISIWVNGVNRGSSTDGVGPPSADTSDLLIGGGTSNNFDGKIDEFKIYNFELSKSEILIDMNAGSSAALGGVLGTHNQEDFAGNPPVGWWKLDENRGSTSAIDESGYSNTGTFTGTITRVLGKSGNGISTNGSNDNYISIPDADQLDATTGVTISVWINPAATNANGDSVICKGNGNGGETYCLDFTPGGSLRPRFYFWKDGILYGAQKPTGISQNSWSHIVGVFDGINLKLYVNNILYATTAGPATLTANTHILSIGCRQSGSTSYGFCFNGKIDNPKVYNFAFTPAQIAYDYNRGAPVAYYAFDECQGTTTYNTALNANGAAAGMNGTYSGTTSVGDCTTASTAWGDGATGKYSASLKFAGADEVVTVTNASGIDLNEGLQNGLTISSWVYPTGAGEGSAGEIFRKTATTFCRLGGSTPFNLTCNLDLGTDATLTVNSLLPVSTWSHVALTWTDDGDDEVTLWINGRPVGTSADGVGPVSADSSSLLIGGGTSNNFAGQIDQFQIYSYEMTDGQIQRLYNEGSAQRFGPLTGSP